MNEYKCKYSVNGICELMHDSTPCSGCADERCECAFCSDEECEEWVSDRVTDCGCYMVPEDVTLEDAAYNLKQYEADGQDIPLMMTEVLFMELWNSYAAQWRSKNRGD